MIKMTEDILKIEEEKLEELLAVKFLTVDNAEFYETKGGFVALKTKDEDFGHVNVIRTFPFSNPDEFISIRKIDGKNAEIGIIENLKDFDEKTVKLIEKQLEIRYFMPRILKINSIKEEFGHTYWSVLTDKGECKFSSSSGSSGSVIHLGDRVIIKDSSENRYEIEDINKLSAKEMKKLELYL